MTATNGWIDKKLSVGNIITILVVLFGVVAAWFDQEAKTEQSRHDIAEIKQSLKDLNDKAATKVEMQAVAGRVTRVEAYRDDTIDRLARIEEGMKSQSRSIETQAKSIDTQNILIERVLKAVENN
ncbi:hypothetical protein FJU08_01430 [Martelella alba]|uniref:Uncharacterized protein n=1 Tax=Martelella alba TaxID=2590451 RepID=A0A506UJ10_9HYPH|nr:hypothetical protein [Martelella alba]TPW33253.1 hypothetical protein FJU08_01430 [Martelella alba]